MKSTIFTIGYEGITLETLVTALAAEKVRTLLDVRELPLSRKPGFSKTPLSMAIRAAGLNYVHLKGLGNPKPNRHQKDRLKFEAAFRAHLSSAVARRDLGEAIRIAMEEPTCLLCFEADPLHCHRALVAEAIAGELGGAIDHLNPRSDKSPRLL